MVSIANRHTNDSFDPYILCTLGIDQYTSTNLILAVIGLLEWVAAIAITVIVIVILTSTSLCTLGNILCIISILLVTQLVPIILWIAAFSHAQVQIGNYFRYCDN